MSGDLLFQVNEWLLFGVLFATLFLAAEIGFQLGHKVNASKKEDNPIFTIQGAVLGLLALLLAFTFSMAASRFDQRKQLVVDEANAIGTTFLRAQALPEPYRSTISQLLKEYVVVRIDFFKAGIDPAKIVANNQETATIHKQLWEQTTALIQLDTRSVPAGLFMQSLNETIDLQSKRLAAFQNRVPESILFLLIFAAICTMSLIGYGFGVSGSRNLVQVLLLCILISSVLIVTLDLDRPRRGVITVSQQSLVDLQKSMQDYP